MKNNFLYLYLALLFGLWGFFYSEKIPVNNGAGWDGAMYIDYAADLPGMLQRKEINQYGIERLLPCAIVYIAAQATNGFSGETPSGELLIQLFDGMNLILFVLSVWFLCRLTDFLQYDKKKKALTLTLTFLSFFFLKMNFFYPVLTDMSGFFVAVLIFDAWFRNKKSILIISGIAGYFVFPALFQIAMLLYLSDRKDQIITAMPVSTLWKIIYGAVAVLVTAVMLWSALTSDIAEALVLHPLNNRLLYISVPAVAFYGYVLLVKTHPFILVKHALQQLEWKRVITAIVIFAVLKTVSVFLANAQSGYNMRQLGQEISYDALANPFVFLVAHATYFGLIVVFIIIFFRSFFERIQSYGGGLIWVTTVYLFFSVNSQSRQLLVVLPLFSLVISDVLVKSISISNLAMATVVVLNILFSKVCWSFSSATWNDRLDEFPMQHYFMNHGPWINNEMYYLQGGIFVMVLLLIYWSSKKYFSIPHQ